MFGVVHMCVYQIYYAGCQIFCYVYCSVYVYHINYAGYQMFGAVQCTYVCIPNILCWMPDIWCWIPDILCKIPEMLSNIPNIWCFILYTRYFIPEFLYCTAWIPETVYCNVPYTRYIYIVTGSANFSLNITKLEKRSFFSPF